MWVFFDFRNLVFWGTTTVGTKLSSTLSMKSCISAKKEGSKCAAAHARCKNSHFLQGSRMSAAITDASLWWAFLSNCLSVYFQMQNHHAPPKKYKWIILIFGKEALFSCQLSIFSYKITVLWRKIIHNNYLKKYSKNSTILKYYYNLK